MATPKQPERLDWDEIFVTLDLEKINDEINAIEEGQPPMPDFDRQDVRELVLIAAARWLPTDLVEWDLDAVEESFEVKDFRGIIDLRGRHKGLFSAFADHKGAMFIGDWKTTKGALDADWANRYKYSWQWKLYALGRPEIRLFTYRGISRQGDTREIIIEVPEGVAGEAKQYLEQVKAMRGVLEGQVPWPRKMPGSCKAYGRDCDFVDQCRENLVIPGQVDFNKPLSYSGSETFLLCPEKHRLTQISGYGEDDETLAFGKSFHRGIAEVYRQAFGLAVSGDQPLGGTVGTDTGEVAGGVE